MSILDKILVRDARYVVSRPTQRLDVAWAKVSANDNIVFDILIVEHARLSTLRQ